MDNTRIKILLPILAGISVLLGTFLFYLAFVFNPITKESLRNDSFFVYDVPIHIDDFSLTDHSGDTVTQDLLANKWTLVFFGYTFCPDICPLTMASIRQFYDLLETNSAVNDVQVAMISVDPNRDTPEKLASYVGFFNPAFIGLTGDYSSLYSLSRQMNVAFSYLRVDEDNYLVTHNGEIMLIDPEGNNVGFFKAPYQPELMLENFQAVKTYLSK